MQVRAGQWAEADTLSELGVYGVYLRRGSDVLLNAEVGDVKIGVLARVNWPLHAPLAWQCTHEWLWGAYRVIIPGQRMTPSMLCWYKGYELLLAYTSVSVKDLVIRNKRVKPWSFPHNGTAQHNWYSCVPRVLVSACPPMLLLALDACPVTGCRLGTWCGRRKRTAMREALQQGLPCWTALAWCRWEEEYVDVQHRQHDEPNLQVP
jgi:hypothetical protein